MTKDIFGREVKVGEYVAVATLSYKRSNLRVGKIISFGPKGFPSVRWAEKRSNGYVTGLSRGVGTFVFISSLSLPVEVVDAIEST